MDKLTASQKLELFYYLFKECGMVGCFSMFNAVVDAIESSGKLPSIKDK